MPFHLEMVDQIERVNSILERFLSFYVNHLQSNWEGHLSIAEYTDNDYDSEKTSVSQFFINKGYNPKFQSNIGPAINLNDARARVLATII